MGRTVKHGSEELLKITVKTLANGYGMTIEDNEYMYFSREKLLSGIIIHLGLEYEEFMSVDGIDKILDGIMDGSLLKSYIEENDCLKKELQKLKKDHKRLNEEYFKLYDQYCDLKKVVEKKNKISKKVKKI